MLIVDDRWLVILPNRHGNTFAKLVLEAAFPGRTRLVFESKHWPLCKAPGDVLARGLTVVGIIRSPVLWYASKWRRFWNDTRPEKRYGFEDYFWRHWRNPHGPIGKNMEDLPLSPAGLGAWSYKHVAYHCLDARRALAGLATRADWQREYPSLLSADEIMRTETLREDMVRVFGERVRPHAATMPIPNASCPDEGVPLWYNADMLAAIREGDGWLVELYPDLKYADLLLEPGS